MDMLDQLNKLEDPDLQALLSHAIRFSLTHNLIASQAAALKDNPQANQAAGIHKDTAVVIDALVKRLLADNPPPEAPAPKATRKAKKAV